MWSPLEDPPRSLTREIDKRIHGRAKFLVDENLGGEMASAIRSFGFNVRFAPDVGLAGRSDEDVFARAWAERRILLTHDRDFLNDRQFPFHRNPGVVVLPGGDGRSPGLARAVGRLLALVGPYRNLFPNAKIEISDDNTWTVRLFDKAQGALVQTRLRFGRKGTVYAWQEGDG